MITRFALDQYAGYLCDRCDEPVGQTGRITLRYQIVWSAICDRCVEEIEDEPPQDRLHINGGRVL